MNRLDWITDPTLISENYKLVQLMIILLVVVGCTISIASAPITCHIIMWPFVASKRKVTATSDKTPIYARSHSNYEMAK